MWIIFACILRRVTSETVPFCNKKLTTIPCVQQLETLTVTLNEVYASNEAVILLLTEWANALPPKNYTLRSITRSIFNGGEITNDYFRKDESKRWKASFTSSTLPNELKNITQVRIKYTVEDVQRTDEFLSTIDVHVNDTIYEFPFKLFKVVDPMPLVGTSTTSTPYHYQPTTSHQTIPEISPTVSSEFPGKLYFFLFILFAFISVVQTILLIWICFRDKYKRWCHQRKNTDSSSHRYSKPAQMPPRNTSSRGDASKCNNIFFKLLLGTKDRISALPLRGEGI